MTDQDGTNNGVVGYMVPKSPAIPVLNDGGIIGWNVCYQLADFAPTFDITGLPSLTFDIGTKSDKT